MADYVIKKIDEMEAIYAGSYKRARAELDVEAFGFQVIPTHTSTPSTIMPRTARRRSTFRCGDRARSRSRVSATASTPRPW
jgi:hypothetical protein